MLSGAQQELKRLTDLRSFGHSVIVGPLAQPLWSTPPLLPVIIYSYISTIRLLLAVPVETRSRMTAAISALIGFKLADHLPVLTPRQAFPFVALSLLSTWSICYLVHLRSETRLLRRALWPVSVASFLWAVLTVDMRGSE